MSKCDDMFAVRVKDGDKVLKREYTPIVDKKGDPPL